MKKHQLLSFIILLALQENINAQGICNPSGNIIIYSNYDGGDFTINIDEDIPNIQIGLCSYEDFHVTITGTYADNVTKVLYAGYNNFGTTSVTGVDAGIVDILMYPEVYLYDPDGNVHMVCAYECDTSYVPGGCNTVDQATDYFLTDLSGSLRYSYYQYGIYSGTYDISDGGNCCYSADCILDVDAGADINICEGETTTLTVLGGDEFVWYEDGDVVACTEPCTEISVTPDATTTYYVYGTNADDCEGGDTITVVVNPYPVGDITYLGGDLVASGGDTYQWYFEGEIIDGATDATYHPTESGIYTVLVTSASGCDDMSDEFAYLNSIEDYLAGLINVYPNPANDVLFIENNSGHSLSIEIFTLDGKAMPVNISEQNNISINTTQLPAGVYVLKMKSGEFTTARNIIIGE